MLFTFIIDGVSITIQADSYEEAKKYEASFRRLMK